MHYSLIQKACVLRGCLGGMLGVVWATLGVLLMYFASVLEVF